MSARYDEKPSYSALASSKSDAEAVPEYDDVLESALDTLDGYQARRAVMDRHLKTAFFSLAQAKQALGPSRVGPASFRLSRLEPLMTINIEDSSSETSQDVSFRIHQTPPVAPVTNESLKGKERERKDPIDLRMAASTSALTLGGKSKKGSGSMRSRLKNAVGGGSGSKEGVYDSSSEKSAAVSGTSASTPEFSKDMSTAKDNEKEDKEEQESTNGPPAYTEAINEYLLDPIQQFSAFPPATLRNAQKEFRRALEESISVLLAQRQFEGMCRAADGISTGKKEA